MIKTIAVVSAGIAALAAALQIFASHRAAAPLAEAAQALPIPAAEARAAAAPTRPMSRREQIARIVAETAAATADRTAHRVLAEKSGVQQTALR